MKIRVHLMLVMLLVASCLLTVTTQVNAQFDPKTRGIASEIPVFCQEWHIWWGFSYTHPDRPMSHMTSRLTSDMEPWRMQWDRNGYPYVGIYDSTNAEIIRWQIRCMKASGLTSTVVMIHPEMTKGITFLNEDNMLLPLLDIAAQENFPIFFMDEVAFRKGSVCQRPNVMAKRIIRWLKKVKDHPGFLKIDGKPVYYYQTFGFFPGIEATTKMMATVEKEIGEVYWMLFGGVEKMAQIPQVDAIISSASVHRSESTKRTVDYSIQDPAWTIAMGHKKGKKVGDMIYPKFDGTAQPWRQQKVGCYGHAGRTFEQHVVHTMVDKPDFLMLSSWNDYEEGAGFEPSWDMDGVTDDPFLYCKMLAHLRGKNFITPPNPPKESVIPMMWEKLGYGDGAGPIIDRVHRTHQRGGSLWVYARDTVSQVTNLEVVWDGDVFWKAAQPGEKKDTGQIKLTKGILGTSYAVKGLMGGFQIGCARELLSVTHQFDLGSTASKLGGQPWIGSVWRFDPTQPLAGLTVTAKSVNVIRLSEPMGSIQTHVKTKLIPANKPREISQQAWEGWQSMVAMPARAIDLKNDSILEISGRGRKLAGLSLLGDPKSERFINAKPQQLDDAGKRVCYRFELPDKVLTTPGVHFAWIRAQDSAGNWGTPKLITVPNYENPWPKLKEPVVGHETLTAPDDAVLVEDMQAIKDWKGKAAVRQQKQTFTSTVMILKNNIVSRKLSKSIEGSFTLTMQMLHTHYQRGGIVALLDQSGKQGLGFLWDSSNEKNFGGQGSVSLLKFDEAETFTYATRGKQISPRTVSGHIAIKMPLAEVKLTYDVQKGELVLSIDGKIKTTAKDSSFSRFDQLLLRGNTSQLYDNIILRPGVH